MIRPNTTYYAYAHTYNAGVLVNADSTPTGSVYRNGSIEAGVTVTVSSLATGFYQFIWTTDPGWAETDTVLVRASATIGGTVYPMMIYSSSGTPAVRTGDQMDLIDAPNATAVTAIQSGLATAVELAKVHKSGETRRYTQVAANDTNKTADVSVGDAL